MTDEPKTDDEKHAFCIQRTGYCATILHRSEYEAAEAAGWDMRWYVMSKPIPRFTQHTPRLIPGMVVRGSIAPSDKPNWDCPGPLYKSAPREKYCGGPICMPGLRGKCTQCDEGD